MQTDMLNTSEKVMKVKDFLRKSRLDQAVTNQTMGKAYTGITPDVLLQQSANLIKISRGEKEPDDRDSLAFSKFLGLEDYIQEHIEKDQGKLQQKALLKIRSKRNLSGLTSGFFTSQLRSTVQGGALSQAIDNSSPLEFLSVSGKVTKFGEGGLPSSEAVQDTTRQVSPASLGFIDPVQLMESEAIGVTQYFTKGVRKGVDGKLYKLVLNNKTNKKEWVDHITLLNSVVEVPDY